MGLGGQAIDAIGREHAYRPITGDVLFIGRQTSYFTPEQLVARLKDHGHAVDRSAIEIDRTTLYRRPHDSELVTDRSIFRALGNNNVRALDANLYEGAEIIHDLNQPLPDSLRGIADFVVDGSTLDNVFDPAMALRNYAELLRPGGRLLAVNAWSTRETAYTLCSPAWFMDYFVENCFSDCKVYVAVAGQRGANLYWIDTAHLHDHGRNTHYVFDAWFRRPFTVVFAEKSSTSTSSRAPAQGHYRSDQDWQSYLAKLAPIRANPRPHLARSLGTFFPRFARRGFTWMDANFMPRPLSPSLPRRWLRRRYEKRAAAGSGAKRESPSS
jgi:SAM-dependent methyltransferase